VASDHARIVFVFGTQARAADTIDTLVEWHESVGGIHRASPEDDEDHASTILTRLRSTRMCDCLTTIQQKRVRYSSTDSRPSPIFSLERGVVKTHGHALFLRCSQ
jgi:hypothetical protein